MEKRANDSFRLLYFFFFCARVTRISKQTSRAAARKENYGRGNRPWLIPRYLAVFNLQKINNYNKSENKAEASALLCLILVTGTVTVTHV